MLTFGDDNGTANQVFDGALEEAASVTGPWSALNASSPFTVLSPGTQKFYRVQVQ